MSTAIDELLLATADVEIQATGKQPSVNIVAYTGGLMSVPGWGPVAIDLDGIDASADQVSILSIIANLPMHRTGGAIAISAHTLRES